MASVLDTIATIGQGGRDATNWLEQAKIAEEAAARQKVAALRQQIQGANVSGATNRPGSTAAGDAFGMFVKAIAQQESGGNYGALGTPVGGDRAYGKYQIMGDNVANWTKAALGRAMTPQQFLNSKQAQDATAKYHLWNYYKQYGPKQAAMAWNQGVGGMEQGWGKEYGHEIMERMRNYGYSAGMPQGNPNNSGGPGGGGGYNGGGGWVSPIAGMTSPTSNYGWRTNPVSGQRSFHEGVDYGAPEGMRVGAAHGGQIVESGYDPVYGKRVIMRTPKGKEILYGHLSKINPRWDVGESINPGQRLGRVGSTGWSTGPHLHFGIYGQGGDPMNPMGIINNMGQPGSPNRPNNGGGGGGNQGGGNQGGSQYYDPQKSDKFNSILRNLGL